MKLLFYIILIFFVLNLKAQNKNTQSQMERTPIPAEVMVGGESSTYQLIVDKRLGPGSSFKFFNLIDYEVDGNNYTPDNYIIQTIGYYEFVKGFDVGVGGNLKAFGGFKPLASLQYTKFSPSLGIIIQPVYELDEDGEFSTLAILEWHLQNEKKLKPYFRFQALTAWTGTHEYSYHRWRLGVQFKQFRLGPALNVSYIGPQSAKLNWGAFLNLLIF